MKATEIKAAKPADRSVSAHVRWVLQRDLERRKMRDAATALKAFVEAHPEEKLWLDEWDSADLAVAPASGPDAQ